MQTRLAPGEGTSTILEPRDLLRVIDPIGQQVADLVAYNADDAAEWLSSGRTIDYAGTVNPKAGHTLYSNRSRPMLKIVQDTVGRNDFMFAACSPEMYAIQYGTADHPNCIKALSDALSQHGIDVDRIVTPFNIFMNVTVDDQSGAWRIHAPLSKAGSFMEFRASMRLIVAVSACASECTNAGAPGPIDVVVTSAL